MHFQKLFHGVVDVGGSGGCVWALGRLELQCCGVACASRWASISVSGRKSGVKLKRTFHKLSQMLSTIELGGLVGTFSATHIGLSAVRERLIDQIGRAADSAGLVGRDVQLPSYWPADTRHAALSSLFWRLRLPRTAR